MTVGELKEILEKVPNKTIVQVGCQGYSTRDDDDPIVRVYLNQINKKDKELLISDECYYGENLNELS